MIKSHLFAAYASCTLLWCNMATDLAAQDSTQTGKQFAFRKVDVPIEGEYIDAVFYSDSLSQELRPKTIIRKESVDFITREGSIKNHVITLNGQFATIAGNGKYVGFYRDGFQIYRDDGELLLRDAPYGDNEDGPGRRYTISSQGVVCNLLKEEGKIIFHDHNGNIAAVHPITGGMSRSLNGEWSADGQFFLVSATMTDMYRDNRIFLFDARGIKLWEKNTDNRWAVEVEFSAKSSWILLLYRDLGARTFGIAILNTQDGSIV